MKKITFTLLIIMLLLTLVGCGHKHEYTDEVVAPTCTEKGYTKHTCECGDTYQDSEVEAKGHSFGEWEVVKEATETAKGSKTRKCSACSETETEEIPMLEHTHKYTDGVCSCGEVDPDYEEHVHEFVDGICDCGEKAIINARFDADGHIITDGNIVDLGGNEKYKAVCWSCYQKLLKRS